MAATEQKPARQVSTTVPLDWNEVWFTNCPMVSATNVDQELGWCREEFKKIGVEYAYFRHAPENNWYPHHIHNLDNLVRFGVLYPPIAFDVEAWARSEFLEQAAVEVLQEEWQKRSWTKLPEGGGLEVESVRLG
jgi:hypothetical protein